MARDALRPGLPPLPSRMLKLPIDGRGYPVPHFVAWPNGKPDHRVMDAKKLVPAVRFHQCWVCGESTGRHMVFLVGPMCVINRVSAEPPMHLECAEFSVKACPFLSRPMAKRRDVGIEDACVPAGEAELRNPGVTAVYRTRSYSPFSADGGILFDMGPPDSVTWMAHGREATRQEVLGSIEEGLPRLLSLANAQGPDAIEQLNRQIHAVVEGGLVPAA